MIDTSHERKKEMLLTSFTVEFFSANCRSVAPAMYCIARPAQNIGKALPYLNAALGSYIYLKEPPLLAFHYSEGKLITVEEESITIYPVRDLIEANGILSWLQGEINAVWERRGEITPRYTAAPWRQPAAILRLLPKSDCGECGQPTCLAFALMAAKRCADVEACPALSPEAREELATYLRFFHSTV